MPGELDTTEIVRGSYVFSTLLDVGGGYLGCLSQAQLKGADVKMCAFLLLKGREVNLYS